MTKWLYGDYAKDYDMTGEIKVGLGTVKVHDIFDPLPEFMKKADVVFVDPPYNIGLLKGFYTKAGLDNSNQDFEVFTKRLFECIAEINPEYLFVEIGHQNLPMYERKCGELFETVQVSQCTYYNNSKNVCFIIYATNLKNPSPNPVPDGVDESKAIDLICSWLPKDKVIGDLCMGRGLVGISAQNYGKQFVGTELNVNRLACLLKKIKG